MAVWLKNPEQSISTVPKFFPVVLDKLIPSVYELAHKIAMIEYVTNVLPLPGNGLVKLESSAAHKAFPKNL